MKCGIESGFWRFKWIFTSLGDSGWLDGQKTEVELENKAKNKTFYKCQKKNAYRRNNQIKNPSSNNIAAKNNSPRSVFYSSTAIYRHTTIKQQQIRSQVMNEELNEPCSSPIYQWLGVWARGIAVDLNIGYKIKHRRFSIRRTTQKTESCWLSVSMQH